jgi:uncharacterized protein (TIRG00374 family)
MQKFAYSVINSFFVLLFVSALIAALIAFTNSMDILLSASLWFFLLACIAFLLSIAVWVFAWSFLVHVHAEVSFSKLFVIGFASLFASLTPIQLGAEAFRCLKAKEHLGVRYSLSLSCSMVVKGLKFLMLTLLASVVLASMLFTGTLSGIMLLGVISGFLIVLLAAFVFLMPFHRALGRHMLKLAHKLFARVRYLKVLPEFFDNYAAFISKLPRHLTLLSAVMAFVSLMLEALALFFVFDALNISFSPTVILMLFVLVSLLDRTPVLPRGVGIVEITSFFFLSLASFRLSAAQAGAIIVLYDLARLIVPVVVSGLVFLIYFSGRRVCKQQAKAQR